MSELTILLSKILLKSSHESWFYDKVFKQKTFKPQNPLRIK